MKLQRTLEDCSLIDTNKECLTLIPQIVELLRMQSYFIASKKIKILIVHLNEIVSAWMDDEFLLILRCVMSAQEQSDYVLLADVLEGDLLPLLQKLQLQQLNQAEIPKELEGNDNYIVFFAVNGQPTVKYRKDDSEICVHSTVNPEREAEFFVRKYLQDDCENYYIYGMGLGYHVMAVLRESKRYQVVVLEREEILVKLALQYQDFSPYIQEGRLKIVCDSNIQNLLQQVRNNKNAQLLVHYPSLQMLPDGEEKNLLENYFMSVNSSLEQKKLLDENFLRLEKIGLPECSALKESFAGKDVVIVAGGPSLDNELKALKKYQKECAILTVGTSAKKLLNHGIVPHAIVISDAQETMFCQIENIERTDIPLILLSTASADIVNHYAGKIYLAYQEGYLPAEEKAKRCGYGLFQTGGSVTTLALDIAINFQAERIILIGTDMAYTNHKSHAEGLGRDIDENIKLRKVESVEGTLVETAQNLDIYRKWIERRIEKIDIPVYNTARGARIHGTIEKNLESL